MSQNTTVGQLVSYLFEQFPQCHCEAWDKCGLLVGDSNAQITGIAIALDPCASAIEKAASLGCNVLLTHHPAYLSAPDRVVDMQFGGNQAAQRIATAIKLGVNLVNMHTNLDRSRAAIDQLLSTLGLEYVDGLVFEDPNLPAFGCIGQLPEGAQTTLGEFAQTCSDSYKVDPRVWGHQNAVVRNVAIANGSSSSFARAIINTSVDCVVAGEMSYHNAQEVAESGIAIIELGHDISEFPLVQVLKNVVEQRSEFAENVHLLSASVCWWQPRMVTI